MKTMHKFLAVVISAALAAGLLAGCGAASSTASSAASSEAASPEAASGQAEDAKVKAEFTVTGADGESQTFTLEVTDGEKLSDALVEADLISEEEAAAGFVTTVNGETADWDKDQAWWCLTDATGEMTTVGVADIALHDGDSYAFTYTKYGACAHPGAAAGAQRPDGCAAGGEQAGHERPAQH